MGGGVQAERMDIGTVSDEDIRAAKDAWLLARPRGERDGVEHAFLLNLVQAQSRQLAAAFRAERAGGAARRAQPDASPPA